ncbi:MAG: acyl-CoA dehydrogenase family protein [Gemmatimonadetes bacterium]|nr:acyl-CoA dehydrogenase family protein [Gemmatimonadota bacterium]
MRRATDRPGVAEFVSRCNAFVDEVLLPLERTFLQGSFRAMKPDLDRARRESRARGLWAPWVPAEHGGLGLTLPEYALVSAALGRSPLGHYACNCQAPDVGNMELLMSHGTDDQRARWLAPLVSGAIRSGFSMTEPEFAGSNPVHMETSAVRKGDQYVINGHKWFTSSADGAAFLIVMAVTNPDAKPHQRASQIIVPSDTPGVTRVRNVKTMGEAGDDWASHAEMRYENVSVPIANRIGDEGAGFALAQERLGPGRIHHCMRWIGICERAIELMLRHASRRLLSPGHPLGEKQVVQHWLAECKAEVEAARLLVLHCAQQIHDHGAKEARMHVSLIKFHTAGVLQRVLDKAIQVHGGLGITDDTPLAYWFRHERAARIYDGPDEVHKGQVARAMLKPYGIKAE